MDLLQTALPELRHPHECVGNTHIHCLPYTKFVVTEARSVTPMTELSINIFLQKTKVDVSVVVPATIASSEDKQ